VKSISASGDFRRAAQARRHMNRMWNILPALCRGGKMPKWDTAHLR
jgi:hypothetical protein